jgi:hypothetical protein
MCNVVFSSPWPMGMETFAITWHPSTMIHRKSFTFKSYPPKPLNQVKSSLDGVVLWWFLFRIVSDSHSPFKMAAVTKNNMFLTVYCCLIWQWVIQHFFLWDFCEICLSDDLYQLCKFNLKKTLHIKIFSLVGPLSKLCVMPSHMSKMAAISKRRNFFK